MSQEQLQNFQGEARSMQNKLNGIDSEIAPSLRELTMVFARIGCLSFGGPAVQIGMMHRSVVEERRWLSEERFLHAAARPGGSSSLPPILAG